MTTNEDDLKSLEAEAGRLGVPPVEVVRKAVRDKAVNIRRRRDPVSVLPAAQMDRQPLRSQQSLSHTHHADGPCCGHGHHERLTSRAWLAFLADAPQKVSDGWRSAGFLPTKGRWFASVATDGVVAVGLAQDERTHCQRQLGHGDDSQDVGQQQHERRHRDRDGYRQDPSQICHTE